MEKDRKDKKRKKSDATQEVGQQKGCPVPHCCDLGERMEAGEAAAALRQSRKVGRGVTLSLASVYSMKA